MRVSAGTGRKRDFRSLPSSDSRFASDRRSAADAPHPCSLLPGPRIRQTPGNQNEENLRVHPDAKVPAHFLFIGTGMTGHVETTTTIAYGEPVIQNMLAKRNGKFRIIRLSK